MIALTVYNLLLTFLSPLIYLYLLFRLSKGKEDGAHWGERWGDLSEAVRGAPVGPRIWVHAVSVGEVIAAAPVLRELRRRLPDAFILLSTTTLSGREVALKQSPPADSVVYYTIDFLPVVARAHAAARADLILLMEWEIWPNFLTQARRRGARVAVLNGRISDKGLRRGRYSGFFTGPGLAAVDVFAMQSAEDARRAVLVGADPGRVRTVGNTKFDESATPLDSDEREALRADLGIPADVPVWVCGSTRPGEEALIADALCVVLAGQPTLRLIVAPRHLDRADEAAAAFEAAGFCVTRRSAAAREQPRGSADAPTPAESPSVLLLDTFGELARVYAVADVAFVGGSLLPFGGHSVFQPLAQGVPTLFGPFMNNQRDIAALAKGESVGFEVQDATTLAAEVLEITRWSREERAQSTDRARGLIERNRGVAARCVDLALELLEAKSR